jgi:hypothetical protein
MDEDDEETRDGGTGEEKPRDEEPRRHKETRKKG